MISLIKINSVIVNIEAITYAEYYHDEAGRPALLVKLVGHKEDVLFGGDAAVRLWTELCRQTLINRDDATRAQPGHQPRVVE